MFFVKLNIHEFIGLRKF